MKLIIAGSRHLEVSSQEIEDILNKCLGDWRKVTEIISGHCRGIDTCGERFSDSHGIKLTIFPANWEQYGDSAGPRRNGQMASVADALLLIWDGTSKGSANMKARMEAMKKPVYEVVREITWR
jgi:hypothetical protein